MPEASFQAPASLLIVGSGVFGLSIAYALTKRPEWASTRITVLDRAARRRRTTIDTWVNFKIYRLY